VKLDKLKRILRRPPKLGLARPKYCDILQFGGMTVSKSFPTSDRFQYAVMPSVGEQVNLFIALLAFINRRWSRWGYYATYVEFTTARLVISDRDSNIEVFKLGIHISIPIWCIQNGNRLELSFARSPGIIRALRELGKSSTPQIDRYFVFGEATARLFAPILQTTFIYSGSLKLNDYFSGTRCLHAVLGQTPNLSRTARKSIGLIASFPEKSDVPGGRILGNETPFIEVAGQTVSYARYFTIETLLIQALSLLAKEVDLDLAIIAKRPLEHGTELGFFESIPESTGIPILFDNLRSSYSIADEFDYLVAVDSTLGFEMLALGKRVAFVCSRFKALGVPFESEQIGHSLGWSPEGPFWTSASEPNLIKNFLKSFIDIPQQSWEPLQREVIPRLMALDPGNQTLLAMLADELNHR
jgi:surface carbohydrate biosynthesis protein